MASGELTQILKSAAVSEEETTDVSEKQSEERRLQWSHWQAAYRKVHSWR